MLDEAQQEVTREADGFAVDADTLGHGGVDDAQCDRITDLPLQHLRARTYQHKRLHSYACVPANSAMEISVGQGINGPNRLGLAPILEMQATMAYMLWSQKIWHYLYLNRCVQYWHRALQITNTGETNTFLHIHCEF